MQPLNVTVPWCSASRPISRWTRATFTLLYKSLPPSIQLVCLPLIEAVRCLAGPTASLPSSHVRDVGWEGALSPGVDRRKGTAGLVGQLALAPGAPAGSSCYQDEGSLLFFSL